MTSLSPNFLSWEGAGPYTLGQSVKTANSQGTCRTTWNSGFHVVGKGPRTMLPMFLFTQTAALGLWLADCPALGGVSEVMAQNIPLCWSAGSEGFEQSR